MSQQFVKKVRSLVAGLLVVTGTAFQVPTEGCTGDLSITIEDLTGGPDVVGPEISLEECETEDLGWTEPWSYTGASSFSYSYAESSTYAGWY